MNPRLVEPGFVVVCAYTWTSPLVPVRTRTARTRRRDCDDIGASFIYAHSGAVQARLEQQLVGIRDRYSIFQI